MPDNEERTAWAFGAVKGFRDMCSGSPLHDDRGKFCKEGMSEALTDLICNLLHLAESVGADPLAIVSHGVGGYAQEAIEPDGMMCNATATIDLTIRHGSDVFPWTPETVAMLMQRAAIELADEDED